MNYPIKTDELFESIKDQWQLKSLAEAWVSLQMPMSGFNEYGEPILSGEDVEYIENALTTANGRITDLTWESRALDTTVQNMEAEIRRLRALLNVADISSDSDPQEVRNREIERERVWFEKEREKDRYKNALVMITSQIDTYGSMQSYYAVPKAILQQAAAVMEGAE